MREAYIIVLVLIALETQNVRKLKIFKCKLYVAFCEHGKLQTQSTTLEMFSLILLVQEGRPSRHHPDCPSLVTESA
jgi:hypothetical protein